MDSGPGLASASSFVIFLGEFMNREELIMYLQHLIDDIDEHLTQESLISYTRTYLEAEKRKEELEFRKAILSFIFLSL